MFDKIMKATTAILVFILCLFGISEAQSSEQAYRIETFDTSEMPAVNLETSGGSIAVNGHAENTVRVEMYVRRGNRYFSPSDTDLSDFEITIKQDGDTVIAEAKRRSSGFGIFRSGSNISISFKALVPESALVDGKTSGGSVSAEGIYNDLSLATSGGSVSAKRVEGVINLKTSGGSVAIEDASGKINARTSGGSITASDIYGEAELRTSGGTIRLDNISAKMSARTSGGSIRGNFLTFSDDIDLRTSGGSIRIDLPEAEHFNLDLRGQRVNAQLSNFSGEFERNRINGKIGDGGPLLSARTSGGSVSLNY